MASEPDLAHVGTGEPFKAVMHGLVIATCAPVLAYNVWALSRRHEWHVALNVALFSAVLALEIFGNLPRHLRGAQEIRWKPSDTTAGTS